MPPLVIGSGTSCTSSSPLPLSFFATILSVGFLSNPSFSTSTAFSWNFAEDSNVTASLLSRIYLSSLAGKLEDKGMAMLSQANMESNVTSAV